MSAAPIYETCKASSWQPVDIWQVAAIFETAKRKGKCLLHISFPHWATLAMFYSIPIFILPPPGWFGHENARGRVHAREEDGQDLPPDGQEHGRKTLPRRVY